MRLDLPCVAGEYTLERCNVLSVCVCTIAGEQDIPLCSDATMCVGNEKIAFLANFDERPKGCSLNYFLGPKARNFFSSLCLNDCLTTIQ